MIRFVFLYALFATFQAAQAQFTNQAFLSRGNMSKIIEHPSGDLYYGASAFPKGFVGRHTPGNTAVWSVSLPDTSMSTTIQMHNTDVYVMSNMYSSSGMYVLVSKIDSSGSLLWSKKITANANINCVAFLVTQSNQIFLGSGACGIPNFILSLDSSGTFLWARSYIPSLSSATHTESLKENNGKVDVLSMCILPNSPARAGFFMYEIDVAGNLISKNDMVVPALDYMDKWQISAFQRDSTGLYFNANIVDAQTGMTACVIKTSLSGNVLWAKSLTRVTPGDILVEDFDMDANGNLYLACNHDEPVLNRARSILVRADASNGNIHGASISDTTLFYSEVATFLDYLTPQKILLGGFGYDGFIMSIDTGFSNNCRYFSNMLSAQNLPMLSNMPYSMSFQTPLFTVQNSGINLQTEASQGVDLCSLVNMEAMESPGMRLYPNPVSSVVMLEFEDATDKRISVYSSRGELLIEKHAGAREVLDLRDLGAGLYFLRVEQHGKVLVKKIVKN